jgi:hypothetical protein
MNEPSTKFSELVHEAAEIYHVHSRSSMVLMTTGVLVRRLVGQSMELPGRSGKVVRSALTYLPALWGKGYANHLMGLSNAI